MTRRLLPLCLLVPGLVLAVAGPAAAHDTGAHAQRALVMAPPSTEGEGTDTMTHVANLQYESLKGGSANQSGSDIEFLTLGDKDYALAGTLRNGLQIVDVTDPKNPELTGVYECPITQGDIQVFRQGGRVLATYTADASIAPTDNSGNRTETNQARFESQCVTEFDAINAEGEDDFDGTELGTFIVDLTDPSKPTTVSFIEVPEGSHNQTVHPSGDYLYNSNSDLIGFGGIPNITIFDISNPEEPRFVQDFKYLPGQPALGEESHDIFFNATGTRAYVASLGSTLILDTTNPEKPSIIEQFVDPQNSLVHQSDVVSLPREDGTTRDLLITTDEQAGALPQSTCPGGGLHVYDITGDKEKDPLANKQGVWFIDNMSPVPGETCTSHVLRLYPDQAMLTIAWYSQGVRTLDISGLADFQGSPVDQAFGDGIGMTEVGSFLFPEDSDTWSFKTNRIERDGSFFGYGNDLARGLDVYRFEGGLVDDRTVPVLAPEDLAAEGCAGVPEATAYVDRDEARDVHERSVDCVIARSISQGSIDDKGRKVYRPAEEVTRGQMATFLVNTLRAAGYDGELPEPGAEDAFSDIGESVHRDAINVLAEAGVLLGNGDGTYEPGKRISRQQLASFLVRTADLAIEPDLKAGGSSPFTDVPADSTHAENIRVGAANELFRGVTPTTYEPTVTVLRDQMASFLTNLLDRLGDVQTGPPSAGAFEDA